MSKAKRTPKARRDMVVVAMILHTKGGAMRDRRERRPKDARRSAEWRDES